MTVSFNEIPGNLRVPFVRFEINPGQAPYQSISRLVLFGQKRALGTAEANRPIMVSGGEDGLFGVNSMLSAMYKVARANGPFQEIWTVPLDDLDGSTPAAGAIAVEGVPLIMAGTIVLYIGALRVAVPITVSMSNADIVSALIAAINKCPSIQVTASAGAAAVKASGSFTIAGPATADGNVVATIAGIPVSTSVTDEDIAADIATSLGAAINAATNLPVTATVAGAVVSVTAKRTGLAPNAYTLVGSSSATGVTITPSSGTLTGGTQDNLVLTANNNGTLGNSIRIETRLSVDDGDLADRLLTITPMAGGAGDPQITDALVNMGDEHWDFIVMPYCQGAYLDEIESWLEARWSPMSMTYGLNFTAYSGSAGAVQAFTSARNSPYTFVMPMTNSPQPLYLLAAAFGAQNAVHMQSPPELSRPMQTVELVGVRAPKAIGDHWSTVQRQSFYYAGASGYIVSAGKVLLDRVVSTYQKDSYGNPDQSFLDVNTLAQLVYGVRFLKQYIEQTYPRAALVDSNPNGLRDFVTVEDIKISLIHAYKNLVALGVFENADLFAELLVVERNIQDPSRVDSYLPLDAVNQLRIFAGNVTNYLQYPA